MLFFILFRRLSPHRRRTVGLAIMALGLVLAAISASAAPGLLIHTLGVTLIGVVLFASAAVSGRRARAAS